MAKKGKAMEEEVLIAEEPQPVQALAEETPEQRDARLKREDYERRDAEAWKDRERILGAPQPRDPEAAKRSRCCF